MSGLLGKGPACPCGRDVSCNLDDCPLGPGSAIAPIEERAKTHGQFADNAYVAQRLREIWRSSPGWEKLSIKMREALDQSAGKFSRILSGNPRFEDHWVDIIGYIELVLMEIRKK